MYIKKSKIPKKYQKEMLGKEIEITDLDGNVEGKVVEEKPQASFIQAEIGTAEPRPQKIAKEKKEKQPKVKKEKQPVSKKRMMLYSFFATMVVASVCFTLGFTFWPVSAEKVFDQMQNYSHSLTSTSKNATLFEEYQNKVSAIMQNAEYMTEIDNYKNFTSLQSEVLNAQSRILNLSFDSKVQNRNKSRLLSCLDSIKKEDDKIAKYLQEHIDDINNNASAKASWETLQIHYHKILNLYNDFYKGCDIAIKNANFKGLYGNDLLQLTINANSEFVSSFANFSLSDKELEKNKATQILNAYKTFVGKYFDAENLIIKNYNFNIVNQETVLKVLELENKTENKINLSYLIQNQFDYTNANLSAEQISFAQAAVVFLTGGLS